MTFGFILKLHQIHVMESIVKMAESVLVEGVFVQMGILEYSVKVSKQESLSKK